MKDLDFLIIGAQKCATTTLFEHLRQHPGIHMPLEKEVPFFTGPECDAAGWASFSDRHFGPPDGRLRGKATPQYMCDPDAAQRIHRLMPGVKLVAILRDEIVGGRWNPGDMLPSESELIEQFAVSRITVRQALRASSSSPAAHIAARRSVSSIDDGAIHEIAPAENALGAGPSPDGCMDCHSTGYVDWTEIGWTDDPFNGGTRVSSGPSGSAAGTARLD